MGTDPSVEKRVCKKCGREKRIGLFPWAQRTNKDGSKSRYRLRHCKVCERKKRKEWRCKNLERRRTYERNWRRDNPDRARASDRRYNSSRKGRKSRKRYEKTEKGRESHARYRERLRQLTADLPIEVVRPYVLRMLKETDAEHIGSGTRGAKSNEGAAAKLAEIVGIPKHRLWDIAHKDRLKSVSVDDADILAMHGDFTLHELYERAQEWAVLTGTEWPTKRRRRKRKPGTKYKSKEEREAQVLAMLEKGELRQGQIAKKLGFTSHGGASKLLQPMLKAGKIERYRPLGQRQQHRYHLPKAD